MKKINSILLFQFVKFGIVGLSNTAISYVIYSLLVYPGLHYIIASVIAFITSVLNSFFWNNKYVFKKEDNQKRGVIHSLIKTYMSYAFSGLILQNLLLFVFISILHISKYLAPLFGLIITIPLNFILNKLWAFKSEKMTKMNTINDVKTLEFPQLGDDRGHLVVVEGGKNVPFDIKRIFYIYGSDPYVVRGQHANRRSEFCLINVSGTSKVKVIDRNGGSKIFNLDRPHTGIYLPAMIWKDMYDFSSDSVLLVLSNEHYDKNEYIRNYDDFIKGI